ncbi:16S rRNA (guanine(527)-N(7))-methyltransferase RsmG [Candidatus Comchoanobacter bicostacola]|uniref:Ribosomal RNA small subunit methyltransferase G n=1 Tax=Candidatus Comchoanobacter bicostacola TaxID=2919598 RepID=A0ABY5DNI0_9GAMM|nr:16S rRNA (guanine(527)-N(7))-methyltransferase RsmG [Candidatus Comchoanobacter bicostacola]UTC24979.1 16S rRNA (guanine(527)-N(7))-methyltransferase RsmG [Candidatus Comchoanobacter bicostacola]
MNHFLKENIQLLGIKCRDQQINQLDQMLAFLGTWNKKHNLTRLTEKRDQEIYHILDALSASHYFEQSNTILDVGTGAGFPGVPLAIMHPNKSFHLVDSNGKKIAYLRALILDLGLNNVTVYHERIEQLPIPNIDAVTARAVADPKTIINLTQHLNPKAYILYVSKNCPGTEKAKIIELNVPESNRTHWLYLLHNSV